MSRDSVAINIQENVNTVGATGSIVSLVPPINPFTLTLAKPAPKPIPTCDECHNKIKPQISDKCCSTCKQQIVPKIDKILNKIRHNCVNLSIYHNRRYHTYKNILFSVFRVPLIILAGGNSFIAVGMQNYLSQNTISIVNALLSILCGVITSIELLLNLQKRFSIKMGAPLFVYLQFVGWG